MTLSFYVTALEGLKKGQISPVNSFQTVNKGTINIKGKETVLVFYRGSWCPYCMTQLQAIKSEVIPKLNKNQQLIGISVDNKISALKMIKKFKLDFPIISDSQAILLKKFNIVNKLSDEIVLKYKNSYKIDVEKDSGEKHHMVAHPAVYIIGKDGAISYVDIHENYKQRTSNKNILKNLHLK